MPLEQSDNSLLGVKEGKDSFEVYYTVTLPTLTESAEIWIPMALSDAFQEVKILEKKVPVNSKLLKDPVLIGIRLLIGIRFSSVAGARPTSPLRNGHSVR